MRSFKKFIIGINSIKENFNLENTLNSIIKQNNVKMAEVYLLLSEDQHATEYKFITDNPSYYNVSTLDSGKFKALISECYDCVVLEITSGIILDVDAFCWVECHLQHKDVDIVCIPPFYARIEKRSPQLFSQSSNETINIKMDDLIFNDRQVNSGSKYIIFYKIRKKYGKNTTITYIHEYLANSSFNLLHSENEKYCHYPLDKYRLNQDLPVFSMHNREPRIWIFGERNGFGGDDNAWSLFNWVINNKPNIKAYFVIDTDYNFAVDENLKKYILVKGSLYWEYCIKNADCFLFNNSAEDILYTLRDAKVYDQARYIYLTHGALGYSPGEYQKKHDYFDMITCESEHASSVASDFWGQAISSFSTSGLARWDKIKEKKASKRLLFLPTWRKSLNNKNFLSSTYYKRIKLFLSDKNLLNILRNNGYILDFSLHFRASNFIENFRGLENDVVKILPNHNETPISELLLNCDALITDYSSVFWDVAIRNCSVFLYQYDKFDFLEERNLTKTFLPSLHKFADVCYTSSEIINALDQRSKNKFKMTEDQTAELNKLIKRPKIDYCTDIYNEIIQKFYRNIDHSNPLNYSSLPFNLSNENFDKYGESIAIVSKYLHQHMMHIPNFENQQPFWEYIQKNSEFDSIIVEPNLFGQGDWGQVFFSPQKTNNFLRKLKDTCDKYNKKLILLKTCSFTYQNMISWDIVSKNNVLSIYFEAERLLSKSENRPVISIVIPIYNNEKYIAILLKAILSQDFQYHYEIICVDDGSNDNSSKIIHNFQEKYGNIHYYKQPNHRQGSARNYGIRVSSGKYILFVDADDEILSNCLSELYFVAERNKADVACGLYSSVNTAQNKYFLNQSCFHLTKAPENFTTDMWPAIQIDSSSVCKLYRRDFLIENSIYFSATFHEDEFFSSILSLKNTAYTRVNKILYLYHDRSEPSGTKNFGTEKLKQILFVAMSIMEQYETLEIDEKIKNLKFGYFVTRVDRFFFKMKDLQRIYNDPLIMKLLGGFLEKIDNECISYNSIHNKNLFLNLKNKSGIQKLSDATDKSQVITNSERNVFDYYKRNKVFFVGSKSKTTKRSNPKNNIPNQSDIYNSTSYKLGNSIVLAFKKPGYHTFKLPINLLKIFLNR